MNRELIGIAKRVNWFDNPETLVKNADRFLCYFMQYCQAKDIPLLKNIFLNNNLEKR